MAEKTDETTLRLALPKGRMGEGVFKLLTDAGIRIKMGERDYRPRISLPGFETKILKPQNIVEMLHLGSRDVGFAGADWVEELKADVVELLDTELDPVRVVAAASPDILIKGDLPRRHLVVASEYENLTNAWIRNRKMKAAFVRSYGATEVFPPEDADCIIDNTATGATLRAGGLEIVDVLMQSSTRFYANPKSLRNRGKKKSIERFVLLIESVLNARKRVMVEVNVTAKNLNKLINLLPCMRKPTVAPLFGEDAYAVKAAVPKDQLPLLIPKIKACGGTDIVVTAPDQLVS